MLDFEDVTGKDASPLNILKRIRTLIKLLSLGIILFVILLRPLVVLKRIFDHTNHHHKHQRGKLRRLAVRNRNYSYHLHEHYNQEVDVGRLAELDEKI